MKKNVFNFIVVLCVLVLASCGSTKVDEQSDKVPRQNKNYLGWVDSTSKDVVYKDGIINLRVKQNLGTFNIGVINEDKKVIPTLSTAEEFTTSSMYLKTSKKMYALRNDGNIKTSASRTTNGISLNFFLDRKFDFTVNFDIIKSSEFVQSDMIKVTYIVTNLGPKREDFSLKTIFDTVLGETDNSHFYTSEKLPINNEVLYRTMQNQKWFVSKNKNASMQFILSGADITPPQLVALANYSTFNQNSWEPDVLSTRAFNTVLSYNNSAVGICWPSEKIEQNESYKKVFYLAFAIDGSIPVGHEYVLNQKSQDENLDLMIDLNSNNKVKESVKVFVSDKSLDETTKINLSKEQLTPEYIQNLIDKITELEKDTSNVKMEEINILNKELDDILSALR